MKDPAAWTAARLDTGLRRGEAVRLWLDGREIEAYGGETLATAILAAGTRVLRLTGHHRAPRGLFCGMGVCFDCVVTVDGRPNRRACLTPVAAGMRVETR